VAVEAGCVTVTVTALPAVDAAEVEEVEEADEEIDAVLEAAVLPGAAVVLFANELVDTTETAVVDALFCDELPAVEEAARLATVAVKGGPLTPQTMFKDTGSEVA
jgi:hypothetical protein